MPTTFLPREMLGLQVCLIMNTAGRMHVKHVRWANPSPELAIIA